MRTQSKVSLVALTAAGLASAFLYVQLGRGAWPFSPGQDAQPQPATAGLEAHIEHRPATPAGSSEAHTRVPVSLPEAQIEGLGIRIEPVRRELISRTIRAVAVVVPDEARLSHVHTRVSGWIERLHVNTTGQRVQAGEHLAEIFSQELFASQNEYLAARRALSQGGSEAMVRGARSRLEVLGMVDAEIEALTQRGEAQRLVTVAAPRGGVVLNRAISVGTAVDPSTQILTIADLSHIWLLAEVAERDAPDVRVGSTAVLVVPGSGLEPFESSVSFVYPTLSERTRTLRIRFEVPNSDGQLRPGMYGTAAILSPPREALTVPRDAIVDTGARQHVFISTGNGQYLPREISLGVAVDDRLEVLEGLQETDRVVASGVFLIDSESRLRASGGGPAHEAH